MSLRRIATIAGHDLHLLRRDPFPLGLLLVAPLLFISFLRPTGLLALIVEGYPGTNGSEQAVPGVAVAFSLFVAGLVGINFFRDQAWGVEPRLRVVARPLEIALGKALFLFAFALTQLWIVLAVGAAIYGMEVRGSALALVVFCLPIAACSVALGLALVAICRSLAQLHAITNVGAAFLAGTGGALVPVRLLPSWARHASPASPAYWAMRGFRGVILDGGGMNVLVRPTVTLLGFTAGALVLATWRLAPASASHH